ncbi:FHA domain-containing protein, partial [Frankia sp. R82]|nr:FHA domain-containing protein [Frankia sp. R82]
MPGTTPLRVITPAGEVTLAGDGSTVVGRARAADITINDGRVSRRHLVLHPSPAGWRVEDVSANGLWRDGRRVGDLEIPGEVRLRLGAADGPEVVLTPLRPTVAPTAPTRAHGPGTPGATGEAPVAAFSTQVPPTPATAISLPAAA